mgnify:CR=1 FL=1|tara:strand:- start:2788 stop:3966 length:1179 start_codon:yes stop_codon:yes gene_type:complete
MNRRDVVLLSTADWHHPLWTNKQHVSISLADEGFRVLYIESLGLRPIRNSQKDYLRIFSRVVNALQPPRQVYSGIWVCSPLVIPGIYRGFPLFLNKLSLSLTINISTFLLRFKDPWLWTYNPLSLMLLNLRKYSIKIYHAVDALQQQPDMPSSLISSEEKRLCQKVDHVFVTSPKLMESLALYSNSIRFDPNVVDYEHFSKSLICNKDDLPEDLASIPEPRIGFIGAISSYKINIHLVADLARTNPKWNFVFIGPTEEGESFTDLNPWSNLQNIYHLGPKKYSILPRYCAGFSCGWLPLCKNKYTESMFPMKFFEYLAAGLPVVATSIDSLIKFSSVTFLCGPSTDEFSIAINSAISGHGPNLNQRLSIARDNSYKNRLKKMLNFISNNSKN